MDWMVIAFGAACFSFGVCACRLASILLNSCDRQLTEEEREEALAWVREHVEKRKLRWLITYEHKRCMLAMIAVVEQEGT